MNPILIKNITIIDSNYDKPLENVSIFIKNGKIADIDKSTCIDIDDGTNIIDGEGMFILPGFIDMHVHLMANGFIKEDDLTNPLANYFYQAVKNMKDTIDAGVTYVRDCGLADIGVKMAVEKKIFPAPKMKISVMPLSITGGHFDFALNSGIDTVINYPGFPLPVCDGVEGVIKKTREVFRAQADFIKVMSTGGVISANDAPEFSQFNVKELKAIVKEADMRDGAKVSSHAHGLGGIKNSIKAGIQFIDHGTFIDRKTAQLMVKKGIYLVPTCSVMKGVVEQVNQGIIKGRSAENGLQTERVHKDNMIMAYKEGVKMLMGTDSGVIPHGNNLKELELLCEIGMSPSEAIASGTIEAAKALEIDDEVGSVEIGKFADLIMVSKNPLVDISHLSNPNNILMVIQDGTIVKDIFNRNI
ncbi:MAG: amidohydrolase family protein [Methanobrevibacter arboriphilus]|uniref:Amidohydrolase family protein n=1 Tax=Methanobrevibacter arboriphilus TaxID=39441 RepID=A0A843ACB7_METAZ|nr:amidohydrolase family protein [Methanobrevibacter arboriphilus]MBF4468324.1 amidohydrolase family protein [Methanobrevibacter arboriphilus]